MTTKYVQQFGRGFRIRHTPLLPDPVKSFSVVARLKAPEGYVGVWVNIYERNGRVSIGGSYSTREKADRMSMGYRHDCIYVWVKR